jgi:hypothetical protein
MSSFEKKNISILEVNKISAIEMCSNDKHLEPIMNNGSIILVSLDKNMNATSSKTINSRRSKISDIKFIVNSEESLIISSNFNNTINIINMLDTSDPISLKGNKSWIHQIELSVDNRRIVSIS